MGSEYPDILGDLVEARRRSERNGVHYVMALQPAVIAPGEATNLRIWLQSCWDVPVDVAITVNLATQPSPSLWVIQGRTELPLEPAEVGELTIPIASATAMEPGEYAVPVAVGVQFETRGLYVRSKKNRGKLDDSLLGFVTGMGLAATVGLGYDARTEAGQRLRLQVSGEPKAGPEPDLCPTFLSHWTVADLAVLGKARQHVNDQQIYIQPKLARDAVYMAFLQEGQERFRDATLPLLLGEAIFAAKILTFAAEYFLSRPEGQEAILIPAYELAYRYGLATEDPVFLIVRADFARMARLAISLSFGLLRRRLGRDVWTVEEQLAVADLVADRVERGGALAPEFLYLPLLLGGLLVAKQVQMPGEKLDQSLNLLAKARQQRADSLGEIPELVRILDALLDGAKQRA
jgi:hypothetical protein